MTIYSPRNKDKLKLASFRKSLLIIDEIQTVPSVILGHLIGQLELIAMHLDSRILLVSATIPHSLKDIPKVNIPEGIVKEYLSKTVKNVSVLEKFDIENIADDKYLLMLNTRKKTVSAWHELNDKTLTYVTAGIRKQDKLARINEIANKNTSNKRVISTQAIEAGIDVSFRKIYREMAPLDSIVQVLGRLNRENDEKSGSLLTVFETDGQHRPYSKVEYQTSKKYLQGMTDSQGLYSILPKYYEEIYENNMESRDQAEKLASNVEAMHFGHAWDMVRSLFDNYYDTVFIPDMENWQGTKESLINRRYAESNHLSATLPKPYHEIGRECFDGDLLEKHILLPKKDKLDYIYDKDIGLDKWLVQ